MYKNIEQIKQVCRKEAQEWMIEAEAQQKRYKTTNNHFVKLSAKTRQHQALRIAHQYLEWADGHRGLISKLIRMHKIAFKGKRIKPLTVSMGDYGAKSGGFVHKRGHSNWQALTLNREFVASTTMLTYAKPDWQYGD